MEKMPSFEELVTELEKHRPEFSIDILTPDIIKMMIVAREKKPPIAFPVMAKLVNKALGIDAKPRTIESAYRINRDRWLKEYGDGILK